MAKMNKTETEQLARKMARENETVQAQTLAQIEASTYDDRKHIAEELARAALDSAIDTYGPMLQDKNRSDFKAYYADQAMSIWGAKAREQENRRKAFRSACNGITAAQAMEKIKALVESFRIRGMKPLSEYSDVSVNVERAWGVSASLYVRLRRTDDDVRNPDDAEQRAGSFRLETELSWSATSRGLADAVAATKLYQELIEVAAEVEAVMRGERVVWTWGVPDREDA